MWRVDGFKTMEEARAYRKEHGGMILWEKRTPKKNALTDTGREYLLAAQAVGLDTVKYPYCVERRV